VTRYRLSPEAEKDLHIIRLYLTKNGGGRVARYVLREIRRSMRLLAERPEIGHWRADLTDAPVKFWSVFSYLIIYDPASRR
jgi:plasmid stabilization system protein ParE